MAVSRRSLSIVGFFSVMGSALILTFSAIWTTDAGLASALTLNIREQYILRLSLSNAVNWIVLGYDVRLFLETLLVISGLKSPV